MKLSSAKKCFQHGDLKNKSNVRDNDLNLNIFLLSCSDALFETIFCTRFLKKCNKNFKKIFELLWDETLHSDWCKLGENQFAQIEFKFFFSFYFLIFALTGWYQYVSFSALHWKFIVMYWFIFLISLISILMRRNSGAWNTWRQFICFFKNIIAILVKKVTYKFYQNIWSKNSSA